MQKVTVGAPVTEAVTMELVDEEGTSASIETELRFDPRDPFAVTVLFKSAGGPVCWTFGRDLLIGGLYDPTGNGDVHVWPCLSPSGAAVVIFELESPSGGVMVQAPTREVHLFVNAMLASVPQGRELDMLDFDAAINALLSA